jgi:hypothetical protein
VHPVLDLLLLRKSGGAGNRTRTSGSVARTYDHSVIIIDTHSVLLVREYFLSEYSQMVVSIGG